MQNVVKVAKRGQIIIPVEVRRKLGIKEGDQLLVEATQQGLLFKPIPRLVDMAGVDAKYGRVEEAKKEIDRFREEY